MSTGAAEGYSISMEGRVLLDRYRIEKRIGRGGMAWVFRASDLKTDTPIALKLLFPHLSEDPLLRSRFIKESELQCSLDHPNIVQVLDLVEDGEHLGFVMEWVGGGDLKQAMQRQKGAFSLKDIRNASLPLLAGLGYAHAAGLVHRDIKPANILLTEDEPPLPKLTDFGIAKMLEDSEEGVTKTGVALGTMRYMSPEQIKDSKKVDHLADIYSFGILLYQLATGQPPFRGAPENVMFQQLYEMPTPPRELRPDLPAALEEVIIRCLQKKPEDRFMSCPVLAHALRESIEQSGASLEISPPPSEQASPAPPLGLLGSEGEVSEEDSASNSDPFSQRIPSDWYRDDSDVSNPRPELFPSSPSPPLFPLFSADASPFSSDPSPFAPADASPFSPADASPFAAPLAPPTNEHLPASPYALDSEDVFETDSSETVIAVTPNLDSFSPPPAEAFPVDEETTRRLGAKTLHDPEPMSSLEEGPRPLGARTLASPPPMMELLESAYEAEALEEALEPPPTPTASTTPLPPASPSQQRPAMESMDDLAPGPKGPRDFLRTWGVGALTAVVVLFVGLLMMDRDPQPIPAAPDASLPSLGSPSPHRGSHPTNRGPATCNPGQTRPCYPGPSATRGVGKCKAGLQTCKTPTAWGPCVGAVLPSPKELCNGVDDDCDGKIDEDIPGLGQSCVRRISGCRYWGTYRCGPRGRQCKIDPSRSRGGRRVKFRLRPGGRTFSIRAGRRRIRARSSGCLEMRSRATVQISGAGFFKCIFPLHFRKTTWYIRMRRKSSDALEPEANYCIR